MRSGILGAKMLFEQPAIIEPVKRGQRFVPLSSCLHHGSKCNLHSRRMKDLVPRILCKPGLSRSRGEIPTHREDHFCSNCCLLESSSILL